MRLLLGSLRLAAASVAVALVCACSSQDGTTTASEAFSVQPPPAAAFAPGTRRVVIEIDYAAGAEPYVGQTGSTVDPWVIFRANVNAVFGATKEISVPTQLADMERLDDIDATSFGERDLLAIAASHRDVKSTAEVFALYFVFLDGYFRDDDGTVLRQVAGVSVRGTGVIAMFKPAISFGLRDPSTPAFMEQATLVHELGHAVGLVDDGIRPTSAHRADEHGRHCNNPACIMYWENVLVKDGVDFVDTYLKPRNNNLFGPECLEDVRALQARRAISR